MKNEWSLISFTLLIQMAVGAFLIYAFQFILELGNRFYLRQINDTYILSILSIAIVALLFSFLHLGKPRNAYNSLNNLKTSWLSREIVFVVLFVIVISVIYILTFFYSDISTIENYLMMIGIIFAIMALLSMSRLYILETVPAWNSVNTYVQFFSSSIILGTLFCIILFLLYEYLSPINVLLFISIALSLIKFFSFYIKLNSMKNGDSAERVSFNSVKVCGKVGIKIYNYSAILLLLSLILIITGDKDFLVIAIITIATIAAEISNRYLFYLSYARKGI